MYYVFCAVDLLILGKLVDYPPFSKYHLKKLIQHLIVVVDFANVIAKSVKLINVFINELLTLNYCI